MTQSPLPPAEKALSGKALGELNRRKFKQWIDSVDAIPANDRGGAHVSEMERLLGISRNAFYTNPGLREMLEEAIAEKGLRPLQAKAAGATEDDGYIRTLEQRIKSLEQRLDAEKAANAELRSKLRRLEALEQVLIASGRLPR